MQFYSYWFGSRKLLNGKWQTLWPNAVIEVTCPHEEYWQWTRQKAKGGLLSHSTYRPLQLSSTWEQYPHFSCFQTHRNMAAFLPVWVLVERTGWWKTAPWECEGGRHRKTFWCDLWMTTKIGSQASGADCGKCVFSAFTGCDHLVYHILSHSLLLSFLFNHPLQGMAITVFTDVWSD